MTEPADFTIAEAAARLRGGSLSPVVLTRAVLDRIAARDPLYHAFLEVDEDGAMEAAHQAEREFARGEIRGPLHGIPYATKDIIDVAGQPTTCNSKIRRDHVAVQDAHVITRLRAAGAILVGKLALHEFAKGGAMWDLPWPPSRNPWDVERHPGGSSSGSGSAVAGGMVPAALGTDTGGSIRHPATACGLVGMKPTYGAVSRHGVFPCAFSLDTVGLLTRTVEDNAIMFEAMKGHDRRDPTSAAVTIPDCLRHLRDGIDGLRIGVIEHFYETDMKARHDFIAAMKTAVTALQRLGAHVTPVRLSPLGTWTACGQKILHCESYVVHADWLKERPQDYSPACRTKLLAGAFIPASGYLKAQQMRTVLCEELRAAMHRLDAVVTLSGMEPPVKMGDRAEVNRSYGQHARMPFNVAGVPAMSVPIGLSKEGLPIGMQIAGKAFDEPTVYRIAEAYCAAAGTTNQRPPFLPPVGEP